MQQKKSISFLSTSSDARDNKSRKHPQASLEAATLVESQIRFEKVMASSSLRASPVALEPRIFHVIDGRSGDLLEPFASGGRQFRPRGAEVLLRLLERVDAAGADIDQFVL